MCVDRATNTQTRLTQNSASTPRRKISRQHWTVQLRSSAVRMTLPAFAAERRAAASLRLVYVAPAVETVLSITVSTPRRRQLSIDIRAGADLGGD